jgi:hypothetical protein
MTSGILLFFLSRRWTLEQLCYKSGEHVTESSLVDQVRNYVLPVHKEKKDARSILDYC